MSTLIKRARRIRESTTLLICTAVAGILVWRGLTFDHGEADLTTAFFYIALAFSLIFTGITAADRQ